MQEQPPEVTDLFKALAEGAGAVEFAIKLVASLESNTGVSTCVYEDRDGLGSLLLAGKKPVKTLEAKRTYTLKVCGFDKDGEFHARLRVIITGELPENQVAQLEEIARECESRVEEFKRERTLPADAKRVTRIHERGATSDQHPVVRWGLLAASSATRQLFDEIDLYGPERAPVLITGETGTGKERVAQALHETSGRRGRLIAVNCGSIAPELIESLLFGYTRGAFTGANTDKKGYFEEADGGTIFLDEIGDMPLKAQVALLRVLQEKKVRRMGAVNEKDLDVRVVAATHRNLERMVAEGAFRSDLYYRLRALTIHILPLRERCDEIQALTDYFLRKISEERGQNVKITEEASASLLTRKWEGNIRELVQCLEAAAVRARNGIIDLQSLALLPELATVSEHPTGPTPIIRDAPSQAAAVAMPVQSFGNRPYTGKSYCELMEEYERCLLQKVLDSCAGNVPRAANVLKMSAITLRRRIRILGLERKVEYLVKFPFENNDLHHSANEDLPGTEESSAGLRGVANQA